MTLTETENPKSRRDADSSTTCSRFSRHIRDTTLTSGASAIHVDYHHTVEDIGICLGQAFCEAIADKKGIARYGDRIVPMDEALILSAVDISGRGMLVFGLDIPTEKVGDFDTELVKEFFIAFASNARLTLHIRQLGGENSHHIIEGAFKSVARSLSDATEIDEKNKDTVPSTKGVL